MSVPYGQPQPAQSGPQPAQTAAPAGPSPAPGELGLSQVLAILTGGLGLILYFLSFVDDVGGYLRTSLLGALLVGGGLLAAASVLPKAPRTLVPAAALLCTGTLFLLIDVTKDPVFLGGVGGVETPPLAVVALALAVLESAACVVAVLAEAGLVKYTPRAPAPQQAYPQQGGWYPQGGGYPGTQGTGGYPAPPAGPGSGGPGSGGPGSGGFSAQPGYYQGPTQTFQPAGPYGPYGGQQGAQYGPPPGPSFSPVPPPAAPPSGPPSAQQPAAPPSPAQQPSAQPVPPAPSPPTGQPSIGQQPPPPGQPAPGHPVPGQSAPGQSGAGQPERDEASDGGRRDEDDPPSATPPGQG